MSSVYKRFQILRHRVGIVLTESVLLALLGGSAGIAIAFWGIKFLTNVLAAGRGTFTLHPASNPKVLAAAFLLTMITGLLFGLAPALQATRVDAMPELKETRVGGPRSGARLRLSLGGMLVISQMAICLLLLVGAGLFVRTLANLRSLQVGFQCDNFLLFKLNARQAILSFYSNVEARLAAIPGRAQRDYGEFSADWRRGMGMACCSDGQDAAGESADRAWFGV